MRKTRSLDLDSPLSTRPRSWRKPALTLLLTLALLPVAYESAARCLANWRSMTGPSVHVETPILNAIQHTLHLGVSAIQHQITQALQNTPWKPSIVIACGLILAALASAPLRRVF